MEVEVRWPWEFVPEHELLDLGDAAGAEIFRRCKANLDASDMVIAILSGPETPIIGIRTDFRNASDTRTSILNAMIDYSCDQIVHSEEDALRYIKQLTA